MNSIWKFLVKILLVATLLFPQQLILAEENQYQSLSIEEQKSACQLSIPQSSVLCDDTPSLVPPVLQPGNAPLPVVDHTELLLVERFEPAKDSQFQSSARLADVYSYNYGTDTLNYSVINLTTGQVVSTENKQRVQLPLTDAEISRSIKIASNNLAVYQLFEKEYLQITGQPLESLDQLEVKAFIFLAESMPGQVNGKTKSCGLHRCARLVIHTSNRIALDTAPIIDLSEGLVSQQEIGSL